MSSKGRFIKGRVANILSDFKIREDHESSRSLSETCSEETMARNPDKMTDMERAIYNTSKRSKTFNKHLSIRHLLTLAVGGAIGTGMFINTGSSLSTGGPASLIIAWTIISTCLFTIVNALGELAAAYPVVGGFNVYVTRFVEPSFGFAINLNYLAQWAVLLPLQLVAASITIRYWNKDVNADIWVAIFYVCIFLANLLDVKSFGETEFVLSMVKILAIVGFTILGIVLICGGGPEGGYIGAKYWHDPGPFVGTTPGSRLKAICSVFVTAAFSYSGTELVAVSAAESINAHRTLPKAAKRTFWLITVSYLSILTVIGCLVSSKDSRLLSNGSSVDVTASPMVIAIENGGINGLPSLMNAIILIAILSVANSSVYACSRCMVPMAEIGNLPRCLTYVDRKGRPIIAILVTLFIGLLSFIAASEKRQEVFTWLSALSGLSSLFCWFAINLAHIRFRRAFKSTGRSLEELPYLSMTGVVGSYYGCIMIAVVLVASFYTSLFPVGGSGASLRSFFEGYLSLPIFLFCYVGHKIYTRNWQLFIRSGDIDVDSGRRNYNLEELQIEKKLERDELKNKSLFMRFIDVWC